MKSSIYYITLLLLIVIATLFTSCRHYSEQTKQLMQRFADKTMVGTNNTRDKQQIADCFIKNVEYFRLYHKYGWQIYANSPDSVKQRYNDYYSKYPGADLDHANFFEPYATRYSLAEDKYVSSPLPTDEQLTVITDSILYSKDSLLCFAFLIIEGKYSSIEGIENTMVAGREYDAKATIGYRKDIEKPFDIYPVTKFNIVGFESYAAAALYLEDWYFTWLKKSGGSGGIYAEKKFLHNVGEEGFFEQTPYFQKHKSGLYNFQMYTDMVKDYPYQYLTCTTAP
ncbi:MAG: hypothetical protein LBV75_06075 [Paludibacter sp.]|jgi:hypothetical protein|nr:hypothetical protein [Paludibacter sp.]